MPNEATHRAVVRDLVVALLKAGIPAVNGRVWPARSWPLQERESDSLLVYAWDETKESQDGSSTVDTRYKVDLTLAVEIDVVSIGRDVVGVERQLELLAGEVCEVVMKAPALLGAGGALERITGVKTAFGIDARTSEKAIGRGLVAFGMRWSEVYDLPLPAIDCEDPDLAFQIVPAP